MGLLTRAKDVAVYSYQKIKSVVAPTIVSIGNVVSTAGQALFTLPKFTKLITKSDHNGQIDLPPSYVLIIANVIVTLATRAPAIFRQFRSNPNDVQEKKTWYQSDCCDGELGAVGTCIYLMLRMLGRVSGGFIALNAFLSAITLSEFIADKIFHAQAHDESWKDDTIDSVGVFFALCSFISFWSFNLKKVDAFAKNLAIRIEGRQFQFDRYTVIAITGATIGTAAPPFLAYYSTLSSLGKLPLITVPAVAKSWVSGVSAITAFSSQMMTNIPAVRRAITEKKDSHYPMSRCELTVTTVVYTAGVLTASATAMSNYVSIIMTANYALSINTSNLTLKVLSGVFGSSTGIMNFIFSVREGYLDTLEHYHNDPEKLGYRLTNVEEHDIELQDEDDNEDELVHGSRNSDNRYTLVSTPATLFGGTPVNIELDETARSPKHEEPMFAFSYEIG